jgi:hypothetical protein
MRPSGALKRHNSTSVFRVRKNGTLLEPLRIGPDGLSLLRNDRQSRQIPATETGDCPRRNGSPSALLSRHSDLRVRERRVGIRRARIRPLAIRPVAPRAWRECLWELVFLGVGQTQYRRLDRISGGCDRRLGCSAHPAVAARSSPSFQRAADDTVAMESHPPRLWRASADNNANG